MRDIHCELLLYGQRIVSAKSNQTHHVELLSRLGDAAPTRCPETFFNSLTPSQSFDILEMQLEAAVAFTRRTRVPCALNASACVFSEPAWIERIIDLVQSTDMPVRLEITEHQPLPPAYHLNKTLSQLRSTSIRIDLDDFGSGRATDTRIFSRYDFDFIKLDRSLIQAGLKTPRNLAALRLLVELIDEHGKGIVAEGVETETDRQRLLEIGVTVHQGFYYHKPEPLEALEAIS